MISSFQKILNVVFCLFHDMGITDTLHVKKYKEVCPVCAKG